MKRLKTDLRQNDIFCIILMVIGAGFLFSLAMVVNNYTIKIFLTLASIIWFFASDEVAEIIMKKHNGFEQISFNKDRFYSPHYLEDVVIPMSKLNRITQSHPELAGYISKVILQERPFVKFEVIMLNQAIADITEAQAEIDFWHNYGKSKENSSEQKNEHSPASK